MEELTARERLIHLTHVRGIGRKTISKLLQIDPSLKSLYTYSPKDLIELLQIPSKMIDQLYYDLHYTNVKSILSTYHRNNIQTITFFDESYPFLLKNIFDPPFVLFCKGNLELFKKNRVLAVVGTRNPSEYGMNVTREFVQNLTEEDFVIVSGLAKGIDITAHKQALLSNGNTIAVVGGGFDYIYPKEHIETAAIISIDNLLISEYPPFTKPQKYHFPERNRIISGLSIGTLVVEAKERSGSLITADCALNEGREVFAIPGPITSETSKGTHYLIQQGAKLVTKTKDILDEIQLPSLIS